jgi:predicted ATPase
MADEPEPRARIIEIGGRSEALGGEVLLRLAEPFTVLVGRNAAGKSALLQLISEIASQTGATGRISDRYGDEGFECTAEIGRLPYRYTARPQRLFSDDGLEEIFKWREECVGLFPGGKKLWSVDAGTVSGLTTKIILPQSAGLLVLDPRNLPGEISPVVAAFGQLFRHVIFVPAGLPGRWRSIFFGNAGSSAFRLQDGSESPRFDRLALQLVRWHQAKDERFERVQAVLRRIGLCTSLSFQVVESENMAIGVLRIDGHELGYASDGTLRVLEIIIALEMAVAGALVMIEEPETGIHPGLCDRIMAEIESAADSLQLIISTHSPRILDRVQYHQLRHVRRNGSTRIEALTPEQVKEARTFLDHQGTLSEYVFSPDFAGEDDPEAG